MLVGQGGATGGYGSRQTGQEEADHVGVALAHDHFIGLDHALLRPVQAVEHAALGVDRRLLRVLVLGTIAAREDAAPEGHRLAAGIEDREHDPASKGVLLPVATIEEAEPGVGHRQHRNLERHEGSLVVDAWHGRFDYCRAAVKVLQALMVPSLKPVENHRLRCSAEPCVKLSGTTCP